MKDNQERPCRMGALSCSQPGSGVRGQGPGVGSFPEDNHPFPKGSLSWESRRQGRQGGLAPSSQSPHLILSKAVTEGQAKVPESCW